MKLQTIMNFTKKFIINISLINYYTILLWYDTKLSNAKMPFLWYEPVHTTQYTYDILIKKRMDLKFKILVPLII